MLRKQAEFVSGLDPPANNRVVHSTERRNIMFQKILTVTLVGAGLATAACNTVRGAAKDVNSVANCTENAMGGGTRC